MPCYDPRNDERYTDNEIKLRNEIDFISNQKSDLRKKYQDLIEFSMGLRKSLMFSDAVSCSLFKVLEKIKDIDSILNLIDYKEAGFTKEELEKWLLTHIEYDRNRNLSQ